MGKGSGKGESVSDNVLKKVLLSYTYVGIWIFLSFTVIVFNKYILDKKMYNWPFPISLTMIHMAFCSALAILLVRVIKLVEPVGMSKEVYLSSIVPFGALYSMSLWFSNLAYIYLSVSFIQMLKALMPVAMYSIGVGLKRDPFKSKLHGSSTLPLRRNFRLQPRRTLQMPTGQRTHRLPAKLRTKHPAFRKKPLSCMWQRGTTP